MDNGIELGSKCTTCGKPITEECYQHGPFCGECEKNWCPGCKAQL